MYTHDRTQALAQYLGVDASTIKNDYNNTYIVNEQPSKDGSAPTRYTQNIKDFKHLLNGTEKRVLTNAVHKASDGKLDYNQRNKVYSRISSYIKSTKYTPSQQEAYNRIKQDVMHVVNIAYWLISPATNTQHIAEDYRTAWLGIEPPDRRTDTTINDGVYLVLTNDEADDAEYNYLDQLFDDTMDIPEELEDYIDKDGWIIDHCDRGNNLASYDGIESEADIIKNHLVSTYYIYRTS